MVDGWLLSEHFGAYRYSDGSGWSLTHLPTGFRVKSLPKLKECVRMAATLERRCGRSLADDRPLKVKRAMLKALPTLAPKRRRSKP